MLLVLKIGWQTATTQRLSAALTQALAGKEFRSLETPEEFLLWCQKPAMDRPEKALLFALPLTATGLNNTYGQWLSALLAHPHCLEGCVGGVLIDGDTELFTKKRARELIFLANSAGCCFPGKPLVEATGSLANFKILAEIQGLNNLGAYHKSVSALVEKLLDFRLPTSVGQHILVLHASIRQTSNTLLLWNLIKEHIARDTTIEEISLRNGEIVDCRGCAYETCLHYGEQGSCFYGGLIVEQVYPAIKRADTLVLLCPNYNDSIGANMMAFINRLTALFRKDFPSFADKRFFAVVVSGYSGGDIIAEQILDALNCNKNFILPPYFSLLATANAPQSILAVPNIIETAASFARLLCSSK